MQVSLRGNAPSDHSLRFQSFQTWVLPIVLQMEKKHFRGGSADHFCPLCLLLVFRLQRGTFLGSMCLGLGVTAAPLRIKGGARGRTSERFPGSQE